MLMNSFNSDFLFHVLIGDIYQNNKWQMLIW